MWLAKWYEYNFWGHGGAVPLLLNENSSQSLCKSKCFQLATNKDQEHEMWIHSQKVTGTDLVGLGGFSFCMKIKSGNEEISVNYILNKTNVFNPVFVI